MSTLPAVAESTIKNLVCNNIANVTHIEVEDVSGGCGSMFNLLIVSDEFKNLMRLKKHKMVHQALGDTMKDLHALSLKLYTVEEYEKISKPEDEGQQQVSNNASNDAQPKPEQQQLAL
ncbi:hypothetical protein GGI07_000677 [Coemansia sp. Benny D115]|nr:hypothetical protein GGI07_000677 [Coemansia sp. Benny D115]